MTTQARFVQMVEKVMFPLDGDDGALYKPDIIKLLLAYHQRVVRLVKGQPFRETVDGKNLINRDDLLAALGEGKGKR
jgi:hypothetical protein